MTPMPHETSSLTLAVNDDVARPAVPTGPVGREAVAGKAPKPQSLASWISGKSIGQLLDDYKGVGPGFDFLRFGLAFMIFYAHTSVVLRSSTDVFAAPAGANLAPIATGMFDWVWAFVQIVKTRLYVLYVPMFFGLSGFLVTASAMRLRNIRTFLTFRSLRIFPALTVEVLLSAVLFGPFFTVLPLGDYFSSPVFFRYFGNILGFVSFHLPGVFESNPQAGLVNANLWTLPAEFYCYLLLSGLMLVGVLKPTKAVLAAIIGLSALAVVANSVFGLGVTESVYSTPVVVFHFLLGSAFYLWRYRLPVNVVLFAISAILVIAMLPFASLAVLAAPVLVYVTVSIGLMKFLSLKLLKGLDYSYGIYLYGFPVTQAVVAMNPSISRAGLLLTALPITVLIAVLSWHFIEKPALRFKRSAKAR
jgi:peptidoglycan/LPS O-acetylase OafA/YrhL